MVIKLEILRKGKVQTCCSRFVGHSFLSLSACKPYLKPYVHRYVDNKMSEIM